MRNAEQQLAGFIGKFEPKKQALIRSTRNALRRRWPGANELVYDNYNFFVIGYSPTERPSDCIVSIAASAKDVSLFFFRGATLPDPHKVLLGSGRQHRFVRLQSSATLRRPEINALMTAAAAPAAPLLAKGERGTLIVRSISKKQRPRRRPQPVGAK